MNDAGIGIFGKLAEISEADHRQVFDTNFWGLVNGGLVATEHLRCFGGGGIINLGSAVSDKRFAVNHCEGGKKFRLQPFQPARICRRRNWDFSPNFLEFAVGVPSVTSRFARPRGVRKCGNSKWLNKKCLK